MSDLLYYISPSGDNPVANFLDTLSKIQQDKLIRIFRHLEEFGMRGPKEHTKKLSGTPFWEIRVLGKDNIRVIYAVVYKGSILLLHGFVKKTQKTPKRELKVSFNRYSEWLKSKPI